MVHLVPAASVLIALVGRKRSKYFFAVACFVLFLFAALRYMFGNDYISYYAHYLTIRAGGQSPYDEWLFTALNQISPSFYVLIALTSAVFLYGVYKLIASAVHMEYAWMGLLIFVINPYLFLMNLSALRQCMAMVFFIAAVHYAVKRKLLPYLLLTVIAFLWHKSAIILLPVWFLADTKRIRKRIVAGILLAMFAMLFFVDLNEIVLWAVQIFDDANYIAHAAGSIGNSLRATLLTLISFVYVLGNLPRLEGKALVYGKLYLVGLAFGVLAYHTAMLTRIQMYFDIFSVAAIPAIIQNTRSHGPILVESGHIFRTLWDILNQYVLPVLVFAVYILRYYSFFTNDSWSAFFTYQSILSIL